MSNISPIENFLLRLDQSFSDSSFIRIAILNKRQKESDIKKISGRIISLKNKQHLSLIYHYSTKEITKNFSFAESIDEIRKLINNDFFQAELFTSNNDWFLSINKDNKGTFREKPASTVTVPDFSHDKVKERIINPVGNLYLRELGITNENGQVKPSMFHKFRQINKYIEIVDGIIKDITFDNSISIVDMGAGKGYLTFALYDYISSVLKQEAHIRGIEFREELVIECRRIASLAGFENLTFEAGTIKDTSLEKTDVLIALHACDTATDEAIYKGITDEAKVIICAPCCHKQIRKQLNPENAAKHITEHGILKERQAEIITDTIRAMIMEAYGYKTKVFEFIETDHTPKNVLIAGVKRKSVKHPDSIIISEIQKLKELFGIKTHHLEILMGISPE